MSFRSIVCLASLSFMLLLAPVGSAGLQQKHISARSSTAVPAGPVSTVKKNAPSGASRSSAPARLSPHALLRSGTGSPLFVPREKPAISLPANSSCFSINAAVFDTLSPAPGALYTIGDFRVAGNTSYTLDLRRFEILAAGATTVAGTENGDQPFAPDKHILFAGTVREIPGSYVYLAVFRSSCTGYIELPQENHPSARRLLVAPLAGAQPVMVVYNEQDVPQQTDFPLCGADEAEHTIGHGDSRRGTTKKEKVKSEETLVAGITVECDYEFYVDHGSNLSQAANYALIVMGASSAVYYRDINVRLQIPYLRVWTSTDPYPATSSSTMLSQYRNYWNSNMTSVDRTLAHMFSGVNGLGGIAYLDVLCNQFWGYGISGLNNNVTFPASGYVWDIDVTSHELGHNFSSPHTHSCSWAPAIDSCYTSEGGCFSGMVYRVGSIMSYCHLSYGKYIAFHPRVMTQMRTSAENASCMPALTAPVANDVAVVSIAEPGNGAIIATSATFTPSAVFRNNGTAGQTSLAVTCTIRTGDGTQVYTSTQTIATLTAGSSATVNFAPTSIATIDVYAITADIALAGDSYPFDNSLQRPFSIASSVSGSVAVTAPNTAATLAAGSSYTINWTRSDVTNVLIEFSADNGATWQLVHSNHSGTSYSWTVPPAPTTQGRIRVSNRYNSAIQDVSDEAFTVTLSNDIQPVEFIVPVSDGSAALPITPQVEFRNNGGSAQTNVPVRLRVVNFSTNREVYSALSTIASIASGTTQTVSFSQFVTTASGNYLFYARALLAGDQDGTNDSLARTAAMTLPPSSLTLTSPNGGELWQSGLVKTISWTNTGIILNVRLEYSTNNGVSWTTIASSVPNTGSYEWTLPSLSSAQGRIRATDIVNSAATDISNAAFTFQFVQPPAGVAASGGDATVALSWSPSPSTGVTAYRIYRGTGSTELSLYTSVGGDQTSFTDATTANCTTYYYAVSAVAGSVESVRSTYAAATPSVTDQLTVTAPDGGEQWQAGIEQAISWDATGCMSTVAIEYSTNNGVSWTTVAASTSNTGSYLWIPPNTGSTQASIRISNTTNASVSDTGNAPFTIVPLLPPASLQAFRVGTTAVLVWTSSVSSGITSYALFRKTGAGSYTLIAELNPSSTTFQDITTAKNTLYTYAVCSRINDVSSEFSTPVEFIYLLPTITPSGPTTFCAGGSVTLDAGGGYASYLWSNGATSQSITVVQSGVYRVTVATVGGYSEATQATVSVLPLPSPSITPNGPTTFCAGGSVILDAGADFTSYLWSNGATTRTITVSASGTYTVTTANASGCTNSTFATVTVTPLPSPSITPNGATTFCAGGSVTLDAGADFTSYLWSNGATTRTITVSASGTYTVTTANASGCTNSTFATVTVLPLPSPSITPNGPTTFCAGGSVTLDAGAGFTSYLWSNGATTRTITVSASGTYTVTTANASGCTNSTFVSITVLPLPAPSITPNGPTTFCAGGSVTLDAGAGFTSYLWSNGATTRTITVAQSGTYTVTTANASGCTNSTFATVTVLPLPAPSITPNGPTTFCAGGSVTLDAGAGFTSYLWSNGATTRTITVSASGTHTVTTANASGCTNSTFATVTVLPLPSPSITPDGPTTFCAGGSVTLDAGAGFTSYLWSNGTTTRTITVSASGTYTVTTANASGCTNSTFATVTVTPLPSPSITPDGPTTFCAGGSVTLDAGAGFISYLWSNGATTRTITVSASGTYTVTTANASGCTNSTFATVTVLPLPSPSITPDGPTTFCQGGSVILDAGADFTSYLWSNGATTRTITVVQSGTYTVTTANASGCTNSTFATVTVLSLPVVSIQGPTHVCSGSADVSYTASATASSYAWTVLGGTITSGSTGASITVIWGSGTSGSISLNASSALGCSIALTESIAISGSPTPTITPDGPTTFCQGDNITLDAGAGYTSYLWSNGATTRTITVDQAGSYTVAVTAAGGCSGSTSLSVSVQSLPPQPAITANTPTVFCEGGSVTLDAGAGYASYLWSNGATTQTITVSTGGTYTVAAANSGGCTNSTSATVTVLPLPAPSITPDGPTTFCEGGSVTLDAGTGFTSYLWSNGATTRMITASSGGTYTVTTENAGGCTNSTVATVTVTPLPSPSITPDGPTTFCEGGSVTLDAGAGFTSYLWSNGTTTQTMTATESGTYTVVVSGAGGCTAGSLPVVVTAASHPVVSAGADTAVCAGGAVQLAANGGMSFTWQPAAGLNNPFVANPVAAPDTTTTYIVTAVNASGCEASDTITVTVRPVDIDITVFLEGPFSGTQMHTLLNQQDILPVQQPYNVAPFNYNGIEQCNSMPESIVDWVLLEFRSATDASVTVARCAALLRNDGAVVSTAGTALELATLPAGSYYVVVRHRTHIAVMSAEPIALASDCSLGHSFSSSQVQAFSVFQLPMKQLAAGVFGPATGDANSDGIVNAGDRVQARNESGHLGYLASDVTLDGIVNAADRVTIRNNTFQVSQVP